MVVGALRCSRRSAGRARPRLTGEPDGRLVGPGKVDPGLGGRHRRDHSAAADNGEAGRAQADRLDRVLSVEHHHVCVAADRDTVALKAHDTRGAFSDGAEAGLHLVIARQMPDMDRHMRDVEHVPTVERPDHVHH